MFLTVLISLYSTRLILKGLGVSDFGIFNVVGGMIAMLNFLNSGMASATQRFLSYAHGEGSYSKLKSIFNNALMLHIIIGVLVILILEILGLFVFNGVLNIDSDRISVAKSIFHFMVVSTFFTIVSVPYDSVLNSNENMLFDALLGIVESFFKLLIALYVLNTSFEKLYMYGLLTAIMTILILCIRIVYCHIKYEEVDVNIKKYFDKLQFNEMLKFAGWGFLGSIMAVINNQGKTIVVNIFFGTKINAAQGVASQIVGQVGAFSNVLLKAINPVIVKSEGAGERFNSQNFSSTGSKLSFFLFLVFTVPLVLELPYFFSIWLDTVPEYAIEFCRITLIMWTLGQLTIALTTSIMATGKIKNYTLTQSLLSILPFIITLYLFYKGYSPVSMYLTYFFVGFTSPITILIYAKKLCGFSIKKYFSDVIFRGIAVALLMILFSLIPFFLIEQGLLRIVLVTCVSTLTFIVSTYYFGLINIEKELIRSLVKSKLKKY